MLLRLVGLINGHLERSVSANIFCGRFGRFLLLATLAFGLFGIFNGGFGIVSIDFGTLGN